MCTCLHNVPSFNFHTKRYVQALRDVCNIAFKINIQIVISLNKSPYANKCAGQMNGRMTCLNSINSMLPNEKIVQQPFVRQLNKQKEF